MSHHSPILSNNDAVPLVSMTMNDANQIINNILELDTLQHTDYVNGIIAGYKEYTMNPSSIDLVNSILKKVPHIPITEYNNVKHHYRNNFPLDQIISQFSISTLAYYGI
tara:strand:+ start:6782 stop:7108 length:327 start_codon:yes stop_codon:yes gene_type:complete